MGAKPSQQGQDVKPGRPYFSPRLVEEIRRFYQENPGEGELDLTEFAQEAARHYLEHLRDRVYRAELLRLAADGRLTPEAVDRLLP